MTQKSLGKCCQVFEQRTGVLAISVFVFMYSMFCGICIFIGDVRLQSGGYNPVTNHFQVWFGACGLFFAYLGFDGVVERRIKCLQAFNLYQCSKLLLLLVVFGFDMYTLTMECDKWSGRIASLSHFNPTLDSVSRKGLCPIARLSYLFGFALDFTMNCYFAYVVYDYAAKLAMGPAYEITFKTMSSLEVDSRRMTFYDPSLGEPHHHLAAPVERAHHVKGEGYGAMHDVQAQTFSGSYGGP